MLHELKAKDKGIREIARETGHSRNTVRKYLRAGEMPEHRTSCKRTSKLDPYKETIGELTSQGIFNCEVIYERIKAEGYAGGRTILRNYVSSFRPPKQTPAVRRYETKPGKQAQIDWGEYIYIDEESCEIRKLYLFVMILGYSRAIYVEFANRCNANAFNRCLIHAFEYFGGVTDVVLTDRMKTVILGIGDDRKPIWNANFSDLAATLGFTPKVCRPYRPQTKGKVERSIEFVKGNFLADRKFTDYGDLNRQALTWLTEKNRRIHGSTGERPIDRLKVENLKPLPTFNKYHRFLTEARKVQKDALLSYDGVRYGVPWRYSGYEVMVREVGGTIEILCDEKVIATHQKCYASRSTHYLEGQYQGIKEAEGCLYPKPKATKLTSLEVQRRPLKVYDILS